MSQGRDDHVAGASPGVSAGAGDLAGGGTLIERVWHWADSRPEKTAFTLLNAEGEGEWEIGYRELRRRAAGAGRELVAAGLRGSNAVLMYANPLDFLIAFLGCLVEGVVPVPLHPPKRNRSNSKIINSLRASRAAAVLSDERTLATLPRVEDWAAWPKDVPYLPTDGFPPAEPGTFQGGAGALERTAFIQFTSGSSSAPKGVVVTEANLAFNSEMIRACAGNAQDTVLVCWVPYFHDLGLVAHMLQALHCGGHCVLLQPASVIAQPLLWLRAIDEYRGTLSGGPNFAYQRCVAKIPPSARDRLDLSSFRVAVNAAEPVNPRTLAQFAEYFKPAGFEASAFLPCYGMAEATVFISGGDIRHEPRLIRIDREAYQLKNQAVDSSDPERSLSLVGCGRSWLSAEIRIVDPVTLGAAGPREVGEIWIAGGHVTPGYYGDEGANAEAFARLHGSDQRYFRTGDLGFLDETGELFVSGRLKDLIIVNGINVYPQDVERAAEAAHPALCAGGSAAFGACEGGTERLVIAMELERSAVAEFQGHAERVRALGLSIRDAVGRSLDVLVGRIVFLRPGQMPRTSSGKPCRQECLKADADGSLVALAEWPTETPGTAATQSAAMRNIETALLTINSLGPAHLRAFTTLLQILSDELRFSIGDLDVEKSIFFYGIDSIKLISLHAELERRLGHRIPTESLFGASTLVEMVNRIVESATAGRPTVRHHRLRDEIDEWSERLGEELARARPAKRPADLRRSILLTGATGYVGVYLLKELLGGTHQDVYCLARALDENAGWARLLKNAGRYQLEMPAGWESRVKVVIGDASKERLGLSPDAYGSLTREVGSVFHCAAIDNFYLPYAVLRDTNVLGTVQMAAFCMRDGIKPLHYVSSCAAELIGEQHSAAEMVGLVNGYAQTKFVTERIVRRLIAQGFPAVNYRFGYLYSLEADMADEEESFETLLTAIFDMRCVPDMDVVFDLTPVEYAAKCIVRRALLPEGAGGKSDYTFYNPVPLRWADLAKSLFRLRPDMKSVPLAEFTERFEDYVRRSNRKSVKLLKSVVSEALRDQLNTMFKGVAVDDLGLVQDWCPPCDEELVAHYVDLVLGSRAERHGTREATARGGDLLARGMSG